MKITLLQTNIKWADSVANQKAAESAISEAEASDVYVFPEMFSTGFATNPVGIAESNNSTLNWMQAMADKYNAAIAGSVAVLAEEGTYRNRFYFVKPSKEDLTEDSVVCYDKRHLFTYGGEDKQYSKGDKRVVVEWRGVKFLLQVCYDLRFPVFARNTKENPYDVILYVANWPNTRRRVWDTLLIARAIENQCYVLGVNRVGDDLTCHYDGGTAVIDAYGKLVEKTKDDESDTITTTLDLERLRKFREKFPVLNDAD